jgi:phosphate:Na+ symporter
MTDAILIASGGLGIFLLGMFFMTEGLRSLAGSGLLRFLERFTTSPTTGAITGAAATAIIQSSSATTIAAVGFVSAGLLTFPQALGIILGANIGTTITGWFVALLGVQFSLGTMLLPVVLFGVLLRMFGRNRWAHAGQALAGFGLVFVGIDMLQQGMAAFEGFMTPDSFPGDSLLGRFALVFIGFAVTVITQSSSAGVAMALTALSAGRIELAQAACIVIGMDIGTTVKSIIATIGASTAAKRTGYAHFVYNVMTAVLALALLDPYLQLWSVAAPSRLADNPEVVLVAFHTIFNALGVALVLPFAGHFARLICWLVPERQLALTRRLDDGLLAEPDSALGAIAYTLGDLTSACFELLGELLRGAAEYRSWRDRTGLLRQQADAARDYTGRLARNQLTASQQKRILAALHVLDHLDRLLDRCEDPARATLLVRKGELTASVGDVPGLLGDARERLAPSRSQDLGPVVTRANGIWQQADAGHDPFRHDVLARAARGELDPDDALAALDSYRWLLRVAYHLWRVLHHVQQVQPGASETLQRESPPTFEQT